MPAPLSIDLRQRVTRAYQAKEGSQRQLAERFKVSLSFVRDLIRRYRQTGSVEAKPHGGGAVAKIGVAQLLVIKALVEAQPDALLQEPERTLYRKNWGAGECIDDAEGCNKTGIERQKKR